MKEVLIIGGKRYNYLSLNNIIDRFERNCRCNFELPNNNNGTKYDGLGLCNHLHEALISHKLEWPAFLKQYRYSTDENYLKYFYDSWEEEHKPKYKEIFHAKFRTQLYNDLLSKWGCPHLFLADRVPRTGSTIIFENIIKQNKVFITLFSLYSDESWVSRSVGPDFRGPLNKWHDQEEEVRILRWLHENCYIDATLCMLEDDKVSILNPKDLEPSEFILNLLREECSNVVIT